jgi:hypothetical protein
MRLLLLILLVFAAQALPALASDPLSDTSVTNFQLAVSTKGEALLGYTLPSGRLRHVLVWGAVNALPPTPGTPQVKFHFDYAGGWGTYRRAVWKTFRNVCRPYDGPQLVDMVVACKAPDGSYWAVQSWQRAMPHRGLDAYAPGQDAWSFDVSHWIGELARVELYVDWPQTFNYETQQIFGQLTYGGRPVYGFHSTSTGNPTDGYGRGAYIDTFDSAYGPGWKRETSVLFRNPTGSFCYAFYPTHDATLPGSRERPAGVGAQYRISVVGPGVTPDVQAVADGIGEYDPSKDADLEQRLLSLYDQVIGGDPFCSTQR